MVKLDLPEDEICKLYLEGFSELSLSKKFNVSRVPIRNVLLKNNIKPRNGSEANYVRMGKLTFEEKQALTKKANSKMRGQAPKHLTRVKQAIAREKLDYLKGFGEDKLAAFLNRKGFKVEQQKAFDIFNIDLMVNDNIAVELTANSNPFILDKNVRKAKLLMSKGYKVIWLTFRNERILEGNFNNVLNILKGYNKALSIYRCCVDEWDKIHNAKGKFEAIPKSPIYFIEQKYFNL